MSDDALPPVPEVAKTVTTQTTQTSHGGESKFVLGKSSMSARSILVIMLTATLCVLTYMAPTDFKETFAAAVGTAIGFYFAQNNRTK